MSNPPLPLSNDDAGLKSGIIYGGGWRRQLREPIQIKAFASLFLTILVASIGIRYYDDYGILAIVPSALLTIVTILLFCFERTTEVPAPQDGDYDIRKLYGRSQTQKPKSRTPPDQDA